MRKLALQFDWHKALKVACDLTGLVCALALMASMPVTDLRDSPLSISGHRFKSVLFQK
jgi:hypothetical protein